MGLGNILILSQVTGYLLSLISSLFIFIPLIINQAEFNGHCLLSAYGIWNDTSDTPHLTHLHWGLNSSCNFPVFVGILTMPVALIYLMWYSIYLLKETEPSWLAAFTALVVHIFLTILMFSAALVLTTGFQAWCSFLTQKYYSCEYVEYIPGVLEEGDVNMLNFHFEFMMAQFGTWFAFVCWTTLSAFAAYKIYLYSRHEEFMVSLVRERERILQRRGYGSGLITADC